MFFGGLRRSLKEKKLETWYRLDVIWGKVGSITPRKRKRRWRVWSAREESDRLNTA